MPTVDTSIEIDAPVNRAYTEWMNFENFPRFMSNVEEVRRTGPDSLHWRAKVAGTPVEWDARVTEQQPNRHIAWRATGESGQDGDVRFQELGPNKCRLDVRIDYKIDGKMKEKAASIVDEGVVKRDLGQFKNLVEGR